MKKMLLFCGLLFLSACLAPVKTFVLSVTTPTGGKISGGNLDCSPACSITLTEGVTVSLLATPDNNYTFLGWEGACIGQANPCNLTIAADTTVGAGFKLLEGSFTAQLEQASLVLPENSLSQVAIAIGRINGLALPTQNFELLATGLYVGTNDSFINISTNTSQSSQNRLVLDIKTPALGLTRPLSTMVKLRLKAGTAEQVIETPVLIVPCSSPC